MTGIDTITASKHWTGDRSEIDYLKAIQFVATTEDGKAISLSTDEEANSEIILTIKAARWVANQLNFVADQIEKGEKSESSD